MQGDDWSIHRDTERRGSGGGHPGWSSDDSDYGERSGSGSGDRDSDYWDGRRTLGGASSYLFLVHFLPVSCKDLKGDASSVFIPKLYSLVLVFVLCSVYRGGHFMCQ